MNRNNILSSFVCIFLVDFSLSLPIPLLKGDQTPNLFQFGFLDEILGPNGLFNNLASFAEPLKFLQDLPLGVPITKDQIKEEDVMHFFNNLLHTLRKERYGDPAYPDLPTLGLCDKSNCKDLYRILEDFRKSELFVNFQTFLSLLEDKDGLETIIGLLTDPETLSTLLQPQPLRPEEPPFKGEELSLIPEAFRPGNNEKKKDLDLPELSFAIDQSPDHLTKPGTGTIDYYDYYSPHDETVKVGDSNLPPKRGTVDVRPPVLRPGPEEPDYYDYDKHETREETISIRDLNLPPKRGANIDVRPSISSEPEEIDFYDHHDSVSNEETISIRDLNLSPDNPVKSGTEEVDFSDHQDSVTNEETISIPNLNFPPKPETAIDPRPTVIKSGTGEIDYYDYYDPVTIEETVSIKDLNLAPKPVSEEVRTTTESYKRENDDYYSFYYDQK